MLNSVKTLVLNGVVLFSENNTTLLASLISGIYYMISRSLGPEFGGAIGIMFTIANSIAVSMYIIGFCDSLLDMIKWIQEDGFQGITGGLDAASRLNDTRLIGNYYD